MQGVVCRVSGVVSAAAQAALAEWHEVKGFELTGVLGLEMMRKNQTSLGKWYLFLLFPRGWKEVV